jgi:hypothetical protein
MSTLAATLDAITSLLQPLVADGTLKAAVTGPREQINDFPAAWVWFGPATVLHDPAGRTTLERHTTRTARVRLYAKRAALLPGAYTALVPLIDAVTATLSAAPVIEGVADRFGVTGHNEPGYDEELGALFVDVSCAALWIDADTYVQDWG